MAAAIDCPVNDPDCLGAAGECHDACERPVPRKAFRAPGGSWEVRRGTRWQHRQCSTPGCLETANWLIARSSFARGAVRWACDPCKAKKYADLEEAQA
jgi:hypothetical protein